MQPAELAKLALVLWGAEVLVRKGKRIIAWRELLTPLFPVAGLSSSSSATTTSAR